MNEGKVYGSLGKGKEVGFPSTPDQYPYVRR